eukprot:29916-Pelagococcus_subviridis.AAC.6
MLPFIIDSGAFATARSIFNVSDLPFTRTRFIRVATSVASFVTNATASEASTKRTPHVTCAPTDRLGGRASHARVSTPLAASRSATPAFGPSARCRLVSGAETTSAHVSSSSPPTPPPPPTPAAASFFRAPRPTPGSSAAGNDDMNAGAAARETWNAPSGFALLVARRAMRRFGPEPTDAAHPVFAKIFRRTSSAMARASSPAFALWVTSTYASSTLTPMTCGVIACNTLYTSSAISLYFSNSYGMTTSRGHSDFACPTRIPALHENARAA